MCLDGHRHINLYVSKMRMLELFSGSGNMARAFRNENYKTLEIDILHGIDIRTLTPGMVIEELGGSPDVIWASPPCTQFSMASVGHHWKDRMPPKDTELVAHTLRLIMQLQPKRWYIENPVGMMRTLNILKYLPRKTLTFCQYGDRAMKPTDVWTNDGLWMPKRCKNGMTCHEKAPRGSKTGTQGKKGAAERGTLPWKLCQEVAKR